MEKVIARRVCDATSTHFPEDMDALLKRIYLSRGVTNVQELSYSLKDLLDYRVIKDIQTAANILAETIENKGYILIVGDYDCDGATAIAVAVLAIKAMGGRVRFIVPNRFEFGYGLTPEIVEKAISEYGEPPNVLVTVDNGISSVEGVKAAKDKGIKVIITDHHLPGIELPCADAIVNPNQEGCCFKGKNSAGVSVIFYVMCVLLTVLKERDWFKYQQKVPKLGELLDLVALGTVADVVGFDANNRRLVSQGVARIRAGHCRPGISALIEVSGRNQSKITSSDLGFSLGPRLNAAGRLEDMSLGVELLLTSDKKMSFEIAQQLDQLNQERKEIEESMRKQAEVIIAAFDEKWHQGIKAGICLYDKGWHQGVIGIVAARIKEQYHRPVIVFADADSRLCGEEQIKGSARSIAGVHIRDIIAEIAEANPTLIISFGGHAMAAGLSLLRVHFEEFSSRFHEVVAEKVKAIDLQEVVWSDGVLAPDEISITQAELLRDAGPWGQNFPEPLFDGEFNIIQQHIVGGKHLKLLLSMSGSQQVFEGICFNIDTKKWPNPQAQKLHLAYKLSINEYRGQKSVNLLISYISYLSVEAVPHVLNSIEEVVV